MASPRVYCGAMYSLLLRLSALDTDAAGALRVIGFFDTLVEHHADVATVLRRTADLAEAPVGIRTADHSISEVAEPGGHVRAGVPSAEARVHRLATGDEVWLERSGEPFPMDALLIERFALAMAVALGAREQNLVELDATTLVQQALRPGLEASDRRRILRHLGLNPTRPVHVLAALGPPADVASISAQLTPAPSAAIGNVTAVLTGTAIDDTAIGVPLGARLGVATAADVTDLATAWKQARTALRFALPSTHASPPYSLEEAAIVRHTQLGSYAAVAENLPAHVLGENADVIALDRLAAEPGGDDLIRTLEAVAATESLRRAAAIVHLHHNSVAHRVARAEPVLGFRISDSYARSRLMLALVLQRLRDSADLF